MEVHREVYLKSKSLSDVKLVNALKEFAQRTTNWSFLDQESEDYSSDVGSPSCMLVYNYDPCYPMFALTKGEDKVYYLANIVPKETGRISMRDYNSLAERFALAFRRFVGRNNIPISVFLSKRYAGLKDIISSKRARGFFERYLHLYPTSYHPKDIERLDTFICAVSRYSRKQLKVDRLQRYLVKCLNWSQKDAEWCCGRIETGLDILEVYKKF